MSHLRTIFERGSARHKYPIWLLACGTWAIAIGCVSGNHGVRTMQNLQTGGLRPGKTLLCQMVSRTIRELSPAVVGEVTSISKMTESRRIVPCIVNHQAVWVVRLDQVRIMTSYEGLRSTNSHIRSLEAFVEEETGQIVRIHSVASDGRKDTRFQELPHVEKLLNMTSEQYVGLPGKPPKVSFASALRRTRFVAEAEHVVAYYVKSLAPDLGEKPRDVWVIQLWGLPRVPFRHGEPKEGSGGVYSWRTVIDGESGEDLWSDSLLSE